MFITFTDKIHLFARKPPKESGKKAKKKKVLWRLLRSMEWFTSITEFRCGHKTRIMLSARDV